jgi:dihydroorotate dehydrogenase electron transfer subunit
LGLPTARGVRMLRIHDNRDETSRVKTILFKEKMLSSPGQFVMVWVPGVDEFPMSASHTVPRLGITYQVVGQGTKALASMSPGQRIGIRGPYGKGFALKGDRILGIAGGAGIAPLAPFLELALTKRVAVDLVLGAKTAEEIIFEERMADAGVRLHISTDDGSTGFKGLATDLAKGVLSEQEFDCIYACGPEKMLVGVLALAGKHGTPVQASLERFMKCGIGICDSCAIDGRHVCRDGPVFSDAELRTFSDLGRTKLDPSGRTVPI